MIASSNHLNLTVFVEDEYTYFADNKPLLAGARVVIDNAFSSEKYEAYTNEAGSY